MSKRILVIEDDYDILCILTDLLNEEGYEVAGLTYTGSITESVRTNQPDLVILDFLLAGVNGGEHCLELKAHPEFSNLPVILMSAEPGCDLPSRRAVTVKSLVFRFGSNFASWSRCFDPFKLGVQGCNNVVEYEKWLY